MGKGFATFSVFVTIGFLSTVGMAADRHAPLYSSRNVGAPTLEPYASLGDESHKQGAYFGYPDEDSLFVVTTGVDRGASFSGPTDYPPQRHTAFSPALDTYFGFYEYNQANNFSVSGKYWQSVGPIGFWSFESDVNDGGDDSGRPSAHESDDGVAVAYHRSDDGLDEFDVWFASYAGGSWSNTRVQYPDGIETHFPFLDRGSDGTWMVVYAVPGFDGLNENIGVSVSTNDGATWTSWLDVVVGVQGDWMMPTGAADPSNGDLYIGFQDFHADSPDSNFDVCLARSTDGGWNWSDPQLVAEGVSGGQAILPSVALDSDHNVHVLYQMNTCEEGNGLICGWPPTGGAGVAMYASGRFDENNEWVEDTAPTNLNSRENLAGIDPGLCGETDIVTMSTDSLTGLPQLGIYHGEGDVLYAAYTQPIYSQTDQQEFLLCGSWQVWMQENRLDGNGWSDRIQVSNITEEQIEDDRAAIYPHLTHEVPAAGPGILWSEMNASTAPSNIYFNRPMEVTDPGPGDPLVVTFSSPQESIWWNDDITVDYSIRNTGEVTESFQAVVNAESYFDNPIVGPIPLVLGPGGELAGQAQLSAPYAYSNGLNTLCLEVGEPGSDPRASDCFDYESKVPLFVTFDTTDPNVRRGETMPVDYLVRNQRSDAAVTFRVYVQQRLPGGEPDPGNPLWGPVDMTLGPDGELAGSAGWKIPQDAGFGGPYRLTLVAEPEPYTGAAPTDWIDYYVTP